MFPILRILSVLGVLAVIAQAGRALFSLLRGGVDMFLARDLHDVTAQRGDLTGMQDALALRRLGRRRRAIAGARLSFWIGLLIIPAYTSWPTQMRAAYCIFFLFPRPRGGAGSGVHVQFRAGAPK